jgi:hypothetical protein
MSAFRTANRLYQQTLVLPRKEANMKRLSIHRFGAFAAACVCSLLTVAAQAQTPVAGPAGALYLADRDSKSQVVRSFQDGFAGIGAVDGRIVVGSAPDYKDNLGHATFAAGHVDVGGTFWVEAAADNPFMPEDSGNALAYSSMLYRLRKDSPSAAFSLNISDGQLYLADFGSAFLPLKARVEVNADVLSADGLTLYSRWTGYAELAGHGGVPFRSTYDYTSQGLSVTAGSYFEELDSFGTTIVSAFLLIPASTVHLDLGAAPTGGQFLVNVTATALAYNQEAESTAYAYLRDPLKFNDADPLAGASGITFAGVTLLPVPEPTTTVLLAAGLLVFARRFWRRDRLHARPLVAAMPPGARIA